MYYPIGMKLFSDFLSRLPLPIAYAHCDIPCGIYTADGAKTAARTVLVMVQKIMALQKPEGDDTEAKLTYKNNLIRMIMNKEEHAGICKKELLTLWTDYFKPEHLKEFPDLHDVFWNAAKLCSKNKQNVSIAAAEELSKAVEKIVVMFDQAEAAKKKA